MGLRVRPRRGRSPGHAPRRRATDHDRRPRRARRRRHGGGAGRQGVLRQRPGRGRGRGGRPRPRCPGDVVLQRRVRVGRGRPARRPSRHDPLEVHGRVHAAVPAGPGGPQRAVRRRGRRAHLGGHGGRHRPRAARGAWRPRCRGGPGRGTPHGRPAPPRRRTGTVHRRCAAGPCASRRTLRGPRVGPDPARPRPVGGGAGRAGRDERTHLQPPLQGVDGHDAVPVAAHAASAAGAGTARDHPARRGPGGGALRVRHGREPARTLPPRTADHALDVPPRVQRGRPMSATARTG